MTLVEEIEKLRDGGYAGVDKHMVKVCESILFYAETFDMKINYARLQYDLEFDLNCRQAEELSIDLWVHLSTKFKIPEEERYLIKAPDKLKDKKRQDWIKKEFKPYFYEWRINNFANPITYAFSKSVVSLRKRGKKGREQGTLEKINRQEIIIQKAKELKVKELLDSGACKWKKDIDKLVADSIPAEKKKKKSGIQYVRKLLKSLNYNP